MLRMPNHHTTGLISSVTLLLAALLTGCGSTESSGAGAAEGPIQTRVMTFNTGAPDCARRADAEYTCDDAAIADEWYGTGLAHMALIRDTRRFFDATRPDVVGFQEIFHADECPDIPPQFHPGFVCEHWKPGDPTVAQRILGEGYTIACHLGRADKCVAVRKDFGRIRGCSADFCQDHLQSGSTQGCGGGTRIARATIDLSGGGELTVVNIHGTSGITREDQLCRVAQFEQVFVDILDGSGEPAANGERTLIVGDLNTDPGRFFITDPSAALWRSFVGPGQAFRQITSAGLLAPPTYLGLINIDHIASNAFDGDCFVGEPTEIRSFDHRPIICDVQSIE
jgi:hypothetical protein